MSSLPPRESVKGARGILFGDTVIEFRCVEQLVDASQTKFIQLREQVPGVLFPYSHYSTSFNSLFPPSMDLVSPWAGHIRVGSEDVGEMH